MGDLLITAHFDMRLVPNVFYENHDIDDIQDILITTTVIPSHEMHFHS